jgi:hypothetical protein
MFVKKLTRHFETRVRYQPGALQRMLETQWIVQDIDQVQPAEKVGQVGRIDRCAPERPAPAPFPSQYR